METRILVAPKVAVAGIKEPETGFMVEAALDQTCLRHP
jgi:hypothetical protein